MCKPKFNRRLRALLRKVECQATQRGFLLGYEFARMGGILYTPKPNILKEFEEIAIKYWEEK